VLALRPASDSHVLFLNLSGLQVGGRGGRGASALLEREERDEKKKTFEDRARIQRVRISVVAVCDLSPIWRNSGNWRCRVESHLSAPVRCTFNYSA
jgi:hypothetical protein